MICSNFENAKVTAKDSKKIRTSEKKKYQKEEKLESRMMGNYLVRFGEDLNKAKNLKILLNILCGYSYLYLFIGGAVYSKLIEYNYKIFIYLY